MARGWVWLFRFQVGVVYAFAGLAKLQPDWLVRALPLELWLPARADVPVLGRLVGFEVTPHGFAIAGAAFDCLIVPLLLWRRTRFPAWLVLVAFHLCTWALFPIGVFPWLMIGASTVFFEPDWPRRLLARAGRPVAVPRVARVRRSPVLVGAGHRLGGGAAGAPASPPRLPGRPPMDGGGLPLLLERAPGGEGRQRDVPRPRAEHRPHRGSPTRPCSTPAPSSV